MCFPKKLKTTFTWLQSVTCITISPESTRRCGSLRRWQRACLATCGHLRKSCFWAHEDAMVFDKLWRLRWQRDRTQRKFGRWIHKAEKEKDRDEHESLITEAMQEENFSNDEIYCAETNQLRHRAERLGLPVPDFSDKTSWERGYNPAISYLNPAARTALRQAIRREWHGRWEFAIVIVKDLAFPLIGIIATVVSLILALKIKHSN